LILIGRETGRLFFIYMKNSSFDNYEEFENNHSMIR